MVWGQQKIRGVGVIWGAAPPGSRWFPRRLVTLRARIYPKELKSGYERERERERPAHPRPPDAAGASRAVETATREDGRMKEMPSRHTMEYYSALKNERRNKKNKLIEKRLTNTEREHGGGEEALRQVQ